MASGPASTRICFGDFEADLATGELRRRSKSVLVQRKPFRILLLLLYARGNLVTREQIVKDVWPDVHVDHQHCLNTAIRKLRTALADDAKSPAILETVGSRGYRLLVPVEFPASHDIAQPASKVALAVLPFKNLSDGENDFFSDGLTEQMIAQLGRSYRNLSVIAPISSMRYRNTSKEILQVGRELNSDYLLCGGVLKGNQRFRITARLLRTEDQVCLWTESYARNDADIFSVQDEITQQIARAIARVLPLPEADNANLTTRPAVYEKFLKAAFYANKVAEPAFLKAVELYEQVIEEDPKFALGYASLAVLFSTVGQYGLMPPDVIYTRINSLASQAQHLSPVLPETSACVGFAELFYYTDFAAAETAFLRALELSQNCIAAHHGYGMLVSAMGRHEEAIALMRQACRIDPFSPMSNALVATFFCLAGRLPEALEHARYTVDMEPIFPTGHACLGWALSAMGEYRAAVEAFRSAVACSPQSSLMLAHLAQGLASAGNTDEARGILQKLLDLRRNQVWASPYWIGLIHLALGETDTALDWLELANQEHDGWRVIARCDRRLDALAAHPRFGQFLQEIGGTKKEKLRLQGVPGSRRC